MNECLSPVTFHMKFMLRSNLRWYRDILTELWKCFDDYAQLLPHQIWAHCLQNGLSYEWLAVVAILNCTDSERLWVLAAQPMIVTKFIQICLQILPKV